MAKFEFKGITAYIGLLERIGPKGSHGILKYALYPGAAVVADAVRAAVESHRDTGELAASIGLAPMQNDYGYVNTKVVFAGYDEKHVPNALKAAVLESGTSDKKHPALHIISKAAKSAQAAAEAAIEQALDEKISQIMEE